MTVQNPALTMMLAQINLAIGQAVYAGLDVEVVVEAVRIFAAGLNEALAHATADAVGNDQEAPAHKDPKNERLH